MTTQQAAIFAIETISTAKKGIIESGIADPQFVFGVCNKLASILGMSINEVVDIMENI